MVDAGESEACCARLGPRVGGRVAPGYPSGVSSLRFLASRRWVLLLLVVLGLTYLAWVLGQWQFSRLDDRREHNTIVERNEGAAATPVAEVLAAGRPVAEDDEWRLVTATGTYAADDTVIVRYRTRDGVAGIDVVVPLVTPDGTALLVDRGWLRTDNRGLSDVDVPPPPAGEVTVEGYVRRDATGDSAAVDDRSTRAISSAEIGPALDREVYGGFVDLHAEDPPAARAPGARAPPGPRRGTALLLRPAVVVLRPAGGRWLPLPGVRRVAQGRACSERPQHPAVDREHHAGQERRRG